MGFRSNSNSSLNLGPYERHIASCTVYRLPPASHRLFFHTLDVRVAGPSGTDKDQTGSDSCTVLGHLGHLNRRYDHVMFSNN